MSAKTFLLPLVAALALAAGGCGGGDGGGTAIASSAAIVPADALVYVTVNLDSDSDQWKKAEDLVKRFPDGPQLLRRAVQEIEEDEDRDWDRDIRPALGDEVGVVVLDVQGDEPVVVGLVKPDDEEKLRAALQGEGNENTVTTKVDDWTVIADAQSSLDAFKTDGDKLDDSEAFQQTMEDLGEDPLVAVYINGPRVIDAFRALAAAEGETQTFQQLFSQGLGRLESAGTALLARDDGVEWTALAKSEPAKNSQGGVGFQESFDTTFDEKVPSGALAFLSFSGGNYQQQLNNLTPQQQTMLRQFESMLGFSVRELSELVSTEGAFYVRPGSPFPEATLLLRTDDEAKARGVLDRVARRLARLGGARVQPTTIAGVRAGQVRVGSITVVYAAFDGMAVVSSAPTGIEALKEGGDSLSGDESYKDALEGAGVPDETSGFLYWNIEDTVPLIRSYAQLSGESVPPQVWTNLRPLRSLVLYGAGDEGEARFSAFLKIE